MFLNASKVHLKRHKYNEFTGFTVVSFSDLPDLPQVLIRIYRIYRCQIFGFTGFTTSTCVDLPDLPLSVFRIYHRQFFGFTGFTEHYLRQQIRIYRIYRRFFQTIDNPDPAGQIEIPDLTSPISKIYNLKIQFPVDLEGLTFEIFLKISEISDLTSS